VVREGELGGRWFARANAPLEDPQSGVSKYALRAYRGALWHGFIPAPTRRSRDDAHPHSPPSLGSATQARRRGSCAIAG
jgi:hypothetical protein